VADLVRPLRGPYAVVVDLDGAWAKSNLVVGGCKHDIYATGGQRLIDTGITWCAKCAAVILSRELVLELAKEIEEFDG
jgi:hypothetical protein